jgi:hypothetical protein
VKRVDLPHPIDELKTERRVSEGKSDFEKEPRDDSQQVCAEAPGLPF